MRFLQPKKFSCFLRTITKSNNINDKENFPLFYDRFLKSVLIENIISVIFLLITLSFMFNLKDDYSHYNDDSFSRNILLKLTNKVKMLNSDAKSFKILIKNMFVLFNEIQSTQNDFDSSFVRNESQRMLLITLTLNFEKIGIKNSKNLRSITNRLKHASYYNDLSIFKFSLNQRPHELMANILKLNSFKNYINVKNLEFNFYFTNFNDSYLRISTVNIEFHPSSMMLIQMNSKMLDVNMDKKLSDLQFLFSFIFLSFFAVFYLFDEIHAIILYKLEYFKDLSKLIDMCLVYFLISLLIRKFLSIYFFNNLKFNFEKLKPSATEKKFLLLNYANYFSFEMTLINLNGIIILLTWLKLSKFVNFTIGHTQMTATMCNSFSYLVSYLIVCITIFMFHSMILSRFFGQTNEEYSTCLLATFTLIRTLLGHINLNFFSVNTSGFLRMIFFSFFFFVFVILLGIFLGVINESYSFVIENYESSPELNYFEFFAKRFLSIKKKIQQKFLNKEKKECYQKLSISKLNLPIEAKLFYDLLVSMDFNKIEINLLFDSNGIKLNKKSNLIQPDICKKVYSKLVFAKNRMDRLKGRKLSFFRPIWFQNSEESTNILDKNKSVLSIANTQRKESSKSKSLRRKYTIGKNEDFSVNDEINLEYNNFYSELITWKEFELLQKRINEFDLKLSQISNEILSICK